MFEVKNSRGYIQGLFDSIIRKDIQQRFKIRYIESLRMLANHMIDNFGQEIIYSDLAERFGFGSSHTAENYVSYLKQTYLLLGIHKFSFKSKERIRNEKSYVVDTAFITERDDAMNGQNIGWKLENITYVELFRITSYNVCYTKLLREHPLLVECSLLTLCLLQVFAYRCMTPE